MVSLGIVVLMMSLVIVVIVVVIIMKTVNDDDYEVCWRIWTLRRNGFRRRSLSFQITKREREVLGSWRCEHEYGRRCCLEWFD